MAELVLAVGVSNSVVESGFSFLTVCILTGDCQCVTKPRKDADHDSIIQMALNYYCKTRRKRKIDKSEFNSMFQPKRSEREEENPLNLEEVHGVDSDLESSGSSESETDSCDSEPEKIFWEFET